MDISGAQEGQTKMWWIARGFAFTSWVFVGAIMLTTHAKSSAAMQDTAPAVSIVKTTK